MKYFLATGASEVESSLDQLNKEVSALPGMLDKFLEKLIDFGMNLLIAMVIFAIGKVVIRA